VGYEYDVFLSYSRGSDAGSWVREHFFRAFSGALDNAMPRTANVFVDWRQETGVAWPQNLAKALLTSRILVPVLSPPYFRSRWCMAEWETMARREQLLGLGTADDPTMLTHPVVFADGEYFPAEAQRIQHANLSDWGYDLPYETYARCPDYLEFLRAVRSFAMSVAKRLEKVPDWQPGWPVARVEPLPDARAALPRLWAEGT
jgi:hypothetical protein